MAATLNNFLGGGNALASQPANAFNVVQGNFAPTDGLSPQDDYLIKFHRDNLRKGTSGQEIDPVTKEKTGRTMTVKIKGVSDRKGGLIYNVPGFDPETGLELSDEEALARAKADGLENYPSFMNPKDSDIAAERLHKIIESDMQTFTGDF